MYSNKINLTICTGQKLPDTIYYTKYIDHNIPDKIYLISCRPIRHSYARNCYLLLSWDRGSKERIITVFSNTNSEPKSRRNRNFASYGLKIHFHS